MKTYLCWYESNWADVEDAIEDPWSGEIITTYFEAVDAAENFRERSSDDWEMDDEEIIIVQEIESEGLRESYIGEPVRVSVTREAVPHYTGYLEK